MLLFSDAEGVGAVDIVRYDPERGGEIQIHVPFGAAASIDAQVRDGGVDFSSNCALPVGCSDVELGAVPVPDYRWSAATGLVTR